jgi:hypothetical protein
MFQGTEGLNAGNATAATPSSAGPNAAEPIAAATEYVCPGSETPVSRSVHLSRLRRGFEECRDCPHREQVGHLSPAAVRAFAANDLTLSSWLIGGAIRGAYLNTLTRPVMTGLAEAAASLFWDDLGGLPPHTAQPGPAVVVGRDTRPMSADLAAGAVAGLRRMGCHVIEIGEVTRPELWFAARHLEAFAGAWITGVGADANCSGLDIVQGGRCWSSPGRLDELILRKDDGFTRPSDRNGTLATFQTARPYLAGLRKHFHAFRPLSILFSCSDRLVANYLNTLLEESPIQAHWDTRGQLSHWQRDAAHLGDDTIDQVISQRLDAVISVDEDGQNCRVWDERGRPVSPLHLLRPLRELIERRRIVHSARQPLSTVEITRTESRRRAPDWLQARAAFVRSRETPDHAGKPQPATSVPPAVPREIDLPRDSDASPSPIVVGTGALPGGGSLGTDVVSAADTLQAMSAAMQLHHARLGLDWRGAFWFDESGPTSDSLLTIARVLQLLSQSDRPLSRLWAE